MSADPFVTYDPPVEIEIQHVTSGARRKVLVVNRHRQVWGIEWSRNIILGFNTTTGQGTADAKDWIVPVEYMRTLRDDPSFKPAPGRTFKPRKTQPKSDPRQGKLPGF